MTRRRILFAVAVSVAIPLGSALAADLAVKAAPVPYAGYDWRGLYVGAEFGYAWATTQSTVLTQATAAPAFPVGYAFNPVSLNGPLGGFYGGYNYQINQFVIGVDGDYNWGDVWGNSSDASPAPRPGFVALHSDELNWIGTATGRLGYAVNNWLLFTKGGWAWAGFTNNSRVINPAGGVANISSATDNRNGWTVGGGLQWGFLPHWSAKLEYDYVKFDTATVTTTEVTSAGVVAYPIRSVTSSLSMVKAGVAASF